MVVIVGDDDCVVWPVLSPPSVDKWDGFVRVDTLDDTDAAVDADDPLVEVVLDPAEPPVVAEADVLVVAAVDSLVSVVVFTAAGTVDDPVVVVGDALVVLLFVDPVEALFGVVDPVMLAVVAFVEPLTVVCETVELVVLPLVEPLVAEGD